MSWTFSITYFKSRNKKVNIHSVIPESYGMQNGVRNVYITQLCYDNALKNVQ